MSVSGPGVKVVESKNRDGSHHGWLWHCPGCDAVHQCDDRWTFNGDVNKPTFRASVLVTCEYGDGQRNERCHSYVTAGRIEFLADCSHASAGKTLDLPDWDERHPTEFHAGSNVINEGKVT